VRETDIVARYGGEEFALILPETTKRLAHELATRVRSNVEASPVVLGSDHHRITVRPGPGPFPATAAPGRAWWRTPTRPFTRARRPAATGSAATALPPPWYSATALRQAQGRPRWNIAPWWANFNGWDPQADPMAPQEAGPSGPRWA